MSRLIPIAIALFCLDCRFDASGLPAGDLGLDDRAIDAPTPSDALLEGRADRPDASSADRGPVDLSGDLPPLPPLTPPPYVVSKDGWGRRLPLVDSGENLNGLWLSASGPAWAVSDNGTILHSTAFGRDWRIVASPIAPSKQELRAVGASSVADVWIVGSAGTVIHYDGKMIAPVTVPTTEDLHAVHAFSPSDVWIVGDANTVLHFDGALWKQLTSPATATASLRGVWGASPAEVWVVGSSGVILRYAAGVGTKLGGSAFTLNAIWGAAANDIWAVGNGGILFHYDGASWGPKPSTTGAALTAIHGTSASEVRAVGANGTVIRLSVGSWKQETLADTPWSLNAIGASGAGNVLVAGLSSTLRRYDGTAWSKLALRATPALSAVWSGGGETWAVGKTGLALRNGVGGWQVIEAPSPTADLNAIWSAPGSDLWVAGAIGLIARWSSSTKSWSKSTSGTISNLNGLWGRSPSDLWAVGASGTILHFDGSSWTTRPALPPGSTLYGVHGTSTHLFAGGASSNVIKFDGTWSVTDLKENTIYRAVWTSAPSSAWFVGDGGALARYDGFQWFVKTWGTNLLGLFGLSPTQLWAVGDSGVVLALDSELNTTSQESDSTVNLTAIHGTSATDLWAVGASGTILHRDDRLP